MAELLAHRGPDDQGHHVEGPIGLASRRLSIIDLEGGHQPMGNEDGSVWVVHNGEIYNYRRLRQELAAAGHRFRTESDTEVILHLYEEEGEACVQRLNGMFAFAIWDAAAEKLVLARDRLGQKPLVYAEEGDSFLFASEVKSLLAASRLPREIDWEALHHYLSLRFIPPPYTMLRHVRKLPPGHVLVYQQGQVRLQRYWDVSFVDKLDLSEAEILEALRQKLAAAVSSHLISDVPVGAFLSGGLDSSMVVALMAQDASRAAVSTFAIGVAEQDFDELPYARLVASHYQTHHVEQRVEADIVRTLPQLIWHLDEPSDPIAACQYQAAALAARHVKVVLGGDGGDELFAGFDRYLGLGYVDTYAALPGFLRRRVIGPALARLPDSFAYKNATQKMLWLDQLAAVPDLGARYAEATCFFRFSHQDKRELYGDALWQSLGHLDSAQVIAGPFNAVAAADPLDRMLYADYNTRLPEHSLMLADRMSMAHSLELRSPLLDHELVEFMAAVPSRLKVGRRVPKALLRKLAGDYLPPDIVRRPKHGFMFPVAYWFRGDLYPLVRDTLAQSTFVKEGLFRRDSVLQLVEDHRQGRRDNHVRLWMLLNLEVWQRIFIQGEDPGRVEATIMAGL